MLVVMLLLLAGVRWCNNHYVFQKRDSKQPTTQQSSSERKKKNNANSDNSYSKNNQNEKIAVAEKNDIPQKVWNVLKYVDENGSAPEGYVGGREFMNREKKLPKTTAEGERIAYQEWDVNPKKRNVNRGTERLITGNDNSAYFTKNHYKSFIKIR